MLSVNDQIIVTVELFTPNAIVVSAKFSSCLFRGALVRTNISETFQPNNVKFDSLSFATERYCRRKNIKNLIGTCNKANKENSIKIKKPNLKIINPIKKKFKSYMTIIQKKYGILPSYVKLNRLSTNNAITKDSSVQTGENVDDKIVLRIFKHNNVYSSEYKSLESMENCKENVEMDENYDRNDTNNLLIKSSENDETSNINSEFDNGDIVWGKLQGHPKWPARIIEVNEEDHFTVKWFDLKDRVSVLHKSKLFPFLKEFRRSYRSKITNNNYRKAVKEARSICNINNDKKLPQITSKSISKNNQVNVKFKSKPRISQLKSAANSSQFTTKCEISSESSALDSVIFDVEPQESNLSMSHSFFSEDELDGDDISFILTNTPTNTLTKTNEKDFLESFDYCQKKGFILTSLNSFDLI